MIRRRLALALASLWLAILADSAHAQAVRVYSGEHPGFSRLVVAFRERVDWTIGRVEGGFEFRSDAQTARFLLGTVFDLIPHDRIRSIRDLGDGRLFLEVSCTCHADAFQLPRGEVVLDIKDGPATTEAREYNMPLAGFPNTMAPATADETPTMSTAESDAPTATAPDLPASTQDIRPPTISALQSRRGLPLLPVLRPLPDLQNETARGLPAPVAPPPKTPSTPEVAEPGESSDTKPENESADAQIADPVADPETDQAHNEERVAEAQQALLEQISRGAAQGLLEADMDIPMLPETPPQSDPPEGDRTTASPTERNAEKTVPDARNHVSIQTAIDEQFRTGNMPAGITEQGFRCPDEEAFAVASWGDDIRDGVDLAPYRSGLVGEFDTAQPEAILKLARYYIYLTFGAEATNLLNRYEEALGDVSMLKNLAEIMDRKYSAHSAEMKPYVECDGDVALWALLSQERIDTGQPINEAAVISAFSRLPLHLRRHFGPDLVARLVDSGKVDLAHSLRNALSRAEDGESPDLTRVEARLAIEDGKISEATNSLEELMQDNTTASPEILKEMVELKLSQDMAASDEDIALLASYAFERRGTELGKELRMLEIRALGQSGRFSEAYARLDEYEQNGALPPEAKTMLETELASFLATKGTDAQFLRYLLPAVSSIHLPEDDKLDIAERFLNLGFPSEARKILDRSATVPSPRERRLLAELATRQGKFDVAIGYLAGLDDPEALKLRAEALAAKHDFPAAFTAMENAGEHERMLQLAWRAGQWAELAARDDGEIGMLSAMLVETARPRTADDPQHDLQQDSELLKRAARTRATISELLDRFPSPQGDAQ